MVFFSPYRLPIKNSLFPSLSNISQEKVCKLLFVSVSLGYYFYRYIQLEVQSCLPFPVVLKWFLADCIIRILTYYEYYLRMPKNKIKQWWWLADVHLLLGVTSFAQLDFPLLLAAAGKCIYTKYFEASNAYLCFSYAVGIHLVWIDFLALSAPTFNFLSCSYLVLVDDVWSATTRY